MKEPKKEFDEEIGIATITTLQRRELDRSIKHLYLLERKDPRTDTEI